MMSLLLSESLNISAIFIKKIVINTIPSFVISTATENSSNNTDIIINKYLIAHVTVLAIQSTDDRKINYTSIICRLLFCSNDNNNNKDDNNKDDNHVNSNNVDGIANIDSYQIFIIHQNDTICIVPKSDRLNTFEDKYQISFECD